jgi:mannose-6-phosphate isomerase-like protein (cupin superfamily)
MSANRSRVVRLAEARHRIPGPAGENAATLVQRGTLDLALSLPPSTKPQAPHAQDELYVVLRGRGVLHHDGEEDVFEAGDVLFVAAGVEHRFAEVSPDCAVWRIFYGARGGEAPE